MVSSDFAGIRNLIVHLNKGGEGQIQTQAAPQAPEVTVFSYYYGLVIVQHNGFHFLTILIVVHKTRYLQQRLIHQRPLCWFPLLQTLLKLRMKKGAIKRGREMTHSN